MASFSSVFPFFREISDVDILICYLEIILSTAKLYELEVRVCDQSALAGS